MAYVTAEKQQNYWNYRNVTESEWLKTAEELRELLSRVKDGEVYCVLRHRADSGMHRRISLFLMIDNRPQDISRLAAIILRGKLHQDDHGIPVSGCGMDMGAHLVENLKHYLNYESPLVHRWI